jgi:hypothetical protein
LLHNETSIVKYFVIAFKSAIHYGVIPQISAQHIVWIPAEIYRLFEEN